MEDQHNGTAPDSGENEQHNGTEEHVNANKQQRDPMIPKARFDQVVQQRKDAEAALDDLANELAEEVPEDMRDVIPDLPPAKRIKWLRSAHKHGLFAGTQVSSGPDSKRPTSKQAPDYDTMTPAEKIAAGLNS